MRNPKSCSPEWTRRHLIQTGTAGVLGMSLPELLAAEAGALTGRVPAAKRVIVILEQGGLSHIDTWDPKPDAVAEHRSPFQPISTTVPGMQFTSLLPRTARLAHKLAVVRSMHHNKSGADAHPNGTQYALSGAHPASAVEMPDVGSVVTRLMGSPNPSLPPYVMIPGNSEQAAETRTGFLPKSLAVFKTGGHDLSDPRWAVADLLARADNTGPRLKDRHSLLSSLDRRFADEASKASLHGMDRFYEQAFNSLTSAEVAHAFDLSAESDPVRDEYGRGHRGSCYLLGRRLLEAGVRFVTVDVRSPVKLLGDST